MLRTKTETSTGIKDALTKREEIVHIIIVAAIFALGIDLIASFVFSKFLDGSDGPIFVGLGFIAFAFLYLSFILLRSRRSFYEFEGVVPIDKNKKLVTVIPRYELTTDMRRTLDAVFLENEAFEGAWKSEPPVTQIVSYSPDEESKMKDNERSDRGSSEPVYFAVVKEKSLELSKPPAMLMEVMEFIVLKQLSLHLSSYFGEFDEKDKQIMEYSRQHVPELLLQNRVLSLLSTPLEDRAIFAKAKLPESRSGTIYTIYSTDGSMYSRFDLILPKKTTVKRPAPGVLTLENSRVSLTLQVRFEGYNMNLPQGFEQAYIGVDGNSIKAFQINVFLATKVKTIALLRGGGWKYYSWVDSFAEKLEEFLHFSRFLQKISWEAAATQRHIGNNLDQQRTARSISKIQNGKDKGPSRQHKD